MIHNWVTSLPALFVLFLISVLLLWYFSKSNQRLLKRRKELKSAKTISYYCHICGKFTGGKRSEGYYVWLVIGILLAPLAIGIIILLSLWVGGNRYCPTCYTVLSKQKVAVK